MKILLILVFLGMHIASAMDDLPIKNVSEPITVSSLEKVKSLLAKRSLTPEKTIIFVDIDDTLLTGGRGSKVKAKLIDPFTQQYLNDWKNAGFKIAFLTSRKESERAATTLDLADLPSFPLFITDGMKKGKWLLQNNSDILNNIDTVIHIDDKNKQLESMQTFCTFAKKNCYTFCFKYSSPTVVEKATSGGNDAVWINKELGKVYKILPKAQMLEELIVNRLYSALGIRVPNMNLLMGNGLGITVPFEGYEDLRKDYEEKNKKYIEESMGGAYLSMSDYIPGDFLSGYLYNNQDNQSLTVMNKVREGFAADAFLGVWDIIKDFKNIMVTPEAIPVRFDMGGGLRYRALGTRKEDQLLLFVNDFDSMRTKTEHGKKAYGSITSQELSKQILDILSKHKKVLQTIDKLVKELGNLWDSKDQDDLRYVIHKRYQDLARYWWKNCYPDLLMQSNQYVPVERLGIANPGVSSAGTLIYTVHQGEAYVLLGERVNHEQADHPNWWGNFGGGSEAKDRTLMDTAIRETNEESMGLYHFLPQDLKRSHEIVAKRSDLDPRPNLKDPDKQMLFRMYMAAGEYIDPKILMDTLAKQVEKEKKEYTEFAWIPVKELFKSLSTGAVGDKTIHPPLLHMLKQGPVQSFLSSLCSGGSTDDYPYTAGHLRLKKKPVHLTISNIKANSDELSQSVFQSSIASREQRMQGDIFDLKESTWKCAVNPENDEQVIAKAAVGWSTVVGKLKNMPPKILQLPESIKEQQLANTPTATEAMVKLYFNNSETFTKERLKELMIESGGWIPEEEKNIKKFMPMAERIALNHTRLKNPAIQFELDRLAEKLFAVSEIEKLHKDKMVFYHGTESKIGFLYNVIKIFRSRLESSDPSGAWLRAFDDTFSSDKDVYEFLATYALKEFGTKEDQAIDLNNINNYHHGFSISGLSVNASIVGSATSTGSNTYRYFYTGESATQNDAFWFLEQFLNRIGLSGSIKAYKDLHDKHIKKNGALLQIFLPPNDESGYVSLKLGRMPFSLVVDANHNKEDIAQDIKQKISDKKLSISDVILELRQDPLAFSKKWHELTLASDEDDEKGIYSLQARLYVHPKFLKEAIINTFWINDVDEKAYQAALAKQIEADLVAWLQKKAPQSNAFLSNKKRELGSDTKPSLQHGYEQHYKQIYGSGSYRETPAIEQVMYELKIKAGPNWEQIKPLLINCSIEDLVNRIKQDHKDSSKKYLLRLYKELPDSSKAVFFKEFYESITCLLFMEMPNGWDKGWDIAITYIENLSDNDIKLFKERLLASISTGVLAKILAIAPKNTWKSIAKITDKYFWEALNEELLTSLKKGDDDELINFMWNGLSFDRLWLLEPYVDGQKIQDIDVNKFLQAISNYNYYNYDNNYNNYVKNCKNALSVFLKRFSTKQINDIISFKKIVDVTRNERTYHGYEPVTYKADEYDTFWYSPFGEAISKLSWKDTLMVFTKVQFDLTKRSNWLSDIKKMFEKKINQDNPNNSVQEINNFNEILQYHVVSRFSKLIDPMPQPPYVPMSAEEKKQVLLNAAVAGRTDAAIEIAECFNNQPEQLGAILINILDNVKDKEVIFKLFNQYCTNGNLLNLAICAGQDEILRRVIYKFKDQTTQLSSLLNSNNALHSAIENKKLDTIKLIVESLKDNPECKKILISMFSRLNDSSIGILDDDGKVLQCIIESLTDQPELLSKIFKMQDNEGRTLLYDCDPAVLKQVIDSLSKQPRLLSEVFESKDSEGRTLLYGCSPAVLNPVIESLTDQPELLSKIFKMQDNEGRTLLYDCDPAVLKQVIDSLSEQPILLSEVFKMQDNEGNNFALIRCKIKKGGFINMIQSLKKSEDNRQLLKEIFTAPGQDNQTALGIITENPKYNQVLQKYNDFINAQEGGQQQQQQ